LTTKAIFAEKEVILQMEKGKIIEMPAANGSLLQASAQADDK
jgi:hypothetical protein